MRAQWVRLMGVQYGCTVVLADGVWSSMGGHSGSG